MDLPKLYYGPRTVPDEYKNLPDRISEMLAGKTILITGGSGFCGKVLIEKILRKCPNVKKIYLLMRVKKDKEPRKRIEDVFNNVIFREVKKLHGDAILKKVDVITGDVQAVDLALSSEDRKLVQDNVELIFHAAATIRFDEPLRKAVLLNTRGTKYTLELAAGCKNLKLFVHISTAYCQLDQQRLEEKMYDSPYDPEKIIKTCELLDEDLIEKISKDILGDFPNSYALTKNLAEHLCNEVMKKKLFPIIVCRPSIIIPTWLEPIPGWSDNINGPTGLLIAAGKGILRSMYCDNSQYADFVPVDIVINGILVATMNYLVENDTKKVVYNLCSNSEWQITWKEIIDLGKDIITSEIPLNNAVWYPGGSMKTSRLYHNICILLFHTIPAYFLDALIYLAGHKPVLVKVQTRIQKGFEVFEYYANNQWDFDNDHIRGLRTLLNERERLEYTIDGTLMDLRHYFSDCILTNRTYLLKESPESIPSARRHIRMMYWVDKLSRVAMLALIFWFFSSYSGSILSFGMALISFVAHIFSFFTLQGGETIAPIRNQ